MSKLRLGIVGVGSVVREIYQHLYFASGFSNDLEIVAAADPSDNQLAWFCDTYGIAPENRFSDYAQMIEKCDLDAVHINTPDSLHEKPTIDALKAGLDVLLPKPLADTVAAAERMRQTAVASGRVLAVDFHKRGDPRVIEAARRYQAGDYGEFQYADWHMIDKIFVVDPNHEPRFFASPDFAEKNSPISFLTVHLADSFMQVVNLRPIAVQARAWSQKLPSLQPKAVNGYDMCETQVTFENYGVAHFVTGWHWPNTAASISNHWARTICTDGVFDMLHTAGYNDITHSGANEANMLFQLTDARGQVSGFGMNVPGQLLREIRKHRDGELAAAEYDQLLTPMALGFWSTAIVEAGHESLRQGYTSSNGVTLGKALSIDDLLHEKLGSAAENITGKT